MIQKLGFIMKIGSAVMLVLLGMALLRIEYSVESITWERLIGLLFIVFSIYLIGRELSGLGKS